MLGSMLYRPQPIVIAMEQFMEVGNTMEINGKEYDVIHAKLTPVEVGVGYAYNGGMYILRNPYPKSLQVDEDKPEINYTKTSRYKLVDYYLLVNVRKIKLKVYAKVTNPEPAPKIALYVADKVIDIEQLETWQDVQIEFPKRIPLSIMYMDVKDKEDAPDMYLIYGNIKDWEFTS